MKKPRICAVVTSSDIRGLKEVEPLVDLFEVRIDLIGDGWVDLAKSIKKPWIACNRMADEGGRWAGNEARRIEQLLRAIELGASIVDIELRAKNLENIVQVIKKRAQCLISSHDMEKTPSLDEMKEVLRQQLKAGADIGKVVTTARSLEDNLTVLRLISEFPAVRLMAFAMGPLGVVSRVLCPLVGGDFTYAAIERGKESAQGQLTVKDLSQIYEMMTV
jgi:3-dehydroquinate dehydratase type I